MNPTIQRRYAYLRPVRGPRPDITRLHLGRVYVPGEMPTESLCRIRMTWERAEIAPGEEEGVTCRVCLAERCEREVKRAREWLGMAREREVEA